MHSRGLISKHSLKFIFSKIGFCFWHGFVLINGGEIISTFSIPFGAVFFQCSKLAVMTLSAMKEYNLRLDLASNLDITILGLYAFSCNEIRAVSDQVNRYPRAKDGSGPAGVMTTKKVLQSRSRLLFRSRRDEGKHL